MMARNNRQTFDFNQDVIVARDHIYIFMGDTIWQHSSIEFSKHNSK